MVPVPVSAMLEAIKASADGFDRAGQDLTAAVESARADGHTWSSIGAALGMSPQSAHRKFGPSKVTESCDGGPATNHGD